MKTRGEHLLLVIIAVVVLAFVLAPLFLMFATAFKADENQILRDFGNANAFWVWPSEMSLENFRQVLGNDTFPVLRYMANSVLIVVSIVVLGILVNSLAAYALARLVFPGRNILVIAVIALIIVPMESLAVPLLLMMNQVGWVDTYQAQIVPFIAHPFSIFLFYQFFAVLPKDLDEAAYVDGASRLQTYWKIVMPLSLPTIATVAILQSLEYWNAFLWPLMVTRGSDVRPISLALAQFFGTPPPIWGDVMAFSVLMSLPILVIYIAFQRWFIQSAIGSGVKG
ncbi:carbohydrate ABC transporter permease [Chthonobacter albigriseus]|uniref:carbohydrate ABC transporter permease n=1 Tax=Chthonobacter albigriseus TaxID=1683161 RepID=UPI0015EE58D8|nr:carbohydrate ABC transporter permease [Chthonobacter albigriseus]